METEGEISTTTSITGIVNINSVWGQLGGQKQTIFRLTNTITKESKKLFSRDQQNQVHHISKN